MAFWLPALAVLRHRNYRLLWIGLFVSMGGSTMRNAALLWHVSLLVPPGQKALALGGVGLTRVVPIVFCSLVAGVAADAFDRRRVLLTTNVALFVVSSGLALLTLSGAHDLWSVYTLSAINAALATFDNPARNSFFPSLVPQDDLSHAIGLNSIVFQAASVIGPAIAGIVIGSANVGWVYVIDATSFLVLIGSLLSMRDVAPRPPSAVSAVTLGAMWDGVRFVFGHPLIRSSMLMDFFATFFASSTALLPIFAQDVLSVGPRGYGMLASASAVGAVVASVVMLRVLEGIEARGRVVIGAALCYGLVTIAFGFSRLFWLSLVCLFLAGAADMVSTVLRNVIRQLCTPDEMRGRMSSVNMIFFMGGPQLGELEAGLAAQALGPVGSVVTGGLGCVLAVLCVAWRTPALTSHRRESVVLVT